MKTFTSRLPAFVGLAVFFSLVAILVTHIDDWPTT